MTTTRKEELRPRLLRLRDAARYLAISAGSLRRLVQNGQIPVVRVSDGNNVPWLIDQVDLDRYIEKTKVTL